MTKNGAGKMWHVMSKFLPFSGILTLFGSYVLVIFRQCPCKIDFNAQCPKRRSKMSCYNLSLHRWQKMEPERCDMSRPLFLYPSFFCGILGVRAGILGKHGKLLLLLAAQKHRVIYALRHWHRRKTLHSDIFLRNTFAKYTSSLRQ